MLVADAVKCTAAVRCRRQYCVCRTDAWEVLCSDAQAAQRCRCERNVYQRVIVVHGCASARRVQCSSGLCLTSPLIFIVTWATGHLASWGCGVLPLTLIACHAVQAVQLYFTISSSSRRECVVSYNGSGTLLNYYVSAQMDCNVVARSCHACATQLGLESVRKSAGNVC